MITVVVINPNSFQKPLEGTPNAISGQDSDHCTHWRIFVGLKIRPIMIEIPLIPGLLFSARLDFYDSFFPCVLA